MIDINSLLVKDIYINDKPLLDQVVKGIINYNLCPFEIREIMRNFLINVLAEEKNIDPEEIWMIVYQHGVDYQVLEKVIDYHLKDIDNNLEYKKYIKKYAKKQQED